MTEEPQNDERVEPVEPADDYDPMIYDAMREAANRLRSLYVARQNEASSEEERQRWLEKQISVRVEADNVDTYSLGAVQELRASFVARFKAEER
ncbi:hypothetical protein [Pseudoclavibacter sp. RFBB5]|uniref:hypothetical protein n=1 Tax=Pseudoclavibacter sp. RFBB5 TaxID=2080574 RepID=UPI0011AFF6E4|nr:hypothetical protein [Pseudoclavibacter sp. RFBB5]